MPEKKTQLTDQEILEIKKFVSDKLIQSELEKMLKCKATKIADLIVMLSKLIVALGVIFALFKGFLR